MIIDVYVRRVIARRIAADEPVELAREFIDTALAGRGITRIQLTLHADRGRVVPLGLDEILFELDGPRKKRCWSTQIVGVVDAVPDEEPHFPGSR